MPVRSVRFLLAVTFSCALLAPADALAGTWTAAGSLTVPRQQAAAAPLQDGRVLVSGGSTPGSGSLGVKSAEIYNPALNSAVPTGDMVQALFGQAMVALSDGRVLVAGGHTELLNGQTANAEIFNPSTGSFSMVAGMASVRQGPAAARLPDGRVLVAGGWTTEAGNETATAEIYDPASNTWAPTGSMSIARGYALALPLLDGRVLLAGGTGVGAAESAELYSPAIGTFAPAPGGLTVARAFAAGGVLPGGRPFITQGGTTSGPTTASETFAASTGTFSVSTPAPDARFQSASATLSDGRIVVAGGADQGGGKSAAVEIYADPLSTAKPALKCKAKKRKKGHKRAAEAKKKKKKCKKRKKHRKRGSAA